MAIVRALRLLSVCLPCCLSFLLSACGGNGSSSPTVAPAENPVPAIASVSPTAATAGSAGFTLTITGSNFLTSSTLMWNGTPQKATFVSSSQLTTTIAATQLAATGTIQLVVSNPTPGGGQASTPFTVSAPAAPAVASVSPNTLGAGTAAILLTVTGTNFVGNSVVQWNGSGRPTTFVSSTRLTVTIPASDLTNPVANLPVTVVTPGPGGGTSNSVPVAVVTPGLPTISSLTPSQGVVGGSAFTLNVSGTNFVGGATVYWNNISRVTQFISSTQLSASILASDLTGSVGNFGITVQNPSPSPGISNVFQFLLQNPAPLLSSVTPSSVIAGNPSSISVIGSGFVTGATVQVGGQSFPITKFMSSTSIDSSITVPVGASILTVTNPSPNAGSSNGLALEGAPVRTGLSPIVASVDTTHNTVETLGSGRLSSTGRYYCFTSYPSASPCLRDTCLGAQVGCDPSTIQFLPDSSGSDIPSGVSSDGRYVAYAQSLFSACPQGGYVIDLVDTCIGVSAGCVPASTQLSATVTCGALGNYVTPDARYISYAVSPKFGPGDAYIYDTCVGAPPGCTPTGMPTVSGISEVSSPTISADGRYLAHVIGSDPAQQVFLYDSCLGAPPGCVPSDKAISAATDCYYEAISSDAQYVVYGCKTFPNGLSSMQLYLQSTCVGGSSQCNAQPVSILQTASNGQFSGVPAVSNGGRYIAYGMSNGTFDSQVLPNYMAFVYDSCNGAAAGCIPQSLPVCLNTSGAVANASCDPGGLSSDGQYVLFNTGATNMGQSVADPGKISYIMKNPLF